MTNRLQRSILTLVVVAVAAIVTWFVVGSKSTNDGSVVTGRAASADVSQDGAVVAPGSDADVARAEVELELDQQDPVEAVDSSDCEISVTVVDATGSPASGATVVASLGVQRLAEGTSAADGTCRLVAPNPEQDSLPFLIRASRDATLSAGVTARPWESVVVTLSDVQGLRLRVVDDETGSPVGDCRVTVFDSGRWSPNYFHATSGRTTQDGRCVLSIPASFIEITLNHPRYERRELSDPIGLAAPGSELVARLTPQELLRVRVVDWSDRPILSPTFGISPWPYDFEVVRHTTEVIDNHTVHVVPVIGDDPLLVVADGCAAGRVVSPEDDDTGGIAVVRLARAVTATGRVSGLDSPQTLELTLFAHWIPFSMGAPLWRLVDVVEEDGQFRLDGLGQAHEYSLEFSSPETPTRMIEFTFDESRESTDLGASIWSIKPTLRARRCIAPIPPVATPRTFSFQLYRMREAVSIGLLPDSVSIFASRARTRLSLRRSLFRRIAFT